ncbi:cation transporter [Synechocystis sp. PCC 7339]|uniref:cation diffusion facilitator family transporter n=1 Tax=unclassified Synechocystis TaxID=2640012 RepID=UPI001BB01B35|nr:MULTISPECIES: cation diffusion facilitator family transporter [unclassified Synechocystis]QUS60854.1 cation transporter [Synechocystis sp. PCC 7338]UAJ73041.1 cation transporter [Synechocystis sp. PCC 7339]
MTARIARPYAVLSIGTALATMGLKLGAYAITGSVGLLSDALESTVNLASAIVAFWALSLAATPADSQHPFGHSKAEYFSSGLEGAFILIAALGIGYSAVERLLSPEPLEQSSLGIGLAIAATVLNGTVAWILWRAGKRLNSITLRADAQHLLTDVWTSVGVVVAVVLIFFTGWQWLDPLIALGVGLNVLWTGIHLLQETFSSLMDKSLDSEQLQKITHCFAVYEDEGVRFHLLQTREAGSQSFISFHVLVPGHWTVQRGHDLCESIEAAIAQRIPDSRVTTHLEPLEDPKSWQHNYDFSPSPPLGQAKPD